MIKRKLFEEEPIKLEDIEQFNFLKSKYLRDQKVEFSCRVCQKKVIRHISHFRDFLCKTHLTEKTFLEKYGVKQVLQKNSPILRKIENIWQEKYNGRPQKNSDIKQKISQGHKKLSEEALKIKKQKKEKTCLEKYNDKNYNNSARASQTKQNFSEAKKKEIQDKTKKTCLQKYKTNRPAQNKNIQLKIQQTNLKRRNTPFAAQSEDVKQKMRQTCLERYGVENYSQTKKAQQNRHSVYTYNDQKFDSKTELCFYIYNLDKGRNIKRNTQSFEYFFENKKHYYFPDFEIDGEFYEIKGNQFLKEDGSWQNPFDHKQDDFYEAKHRCALQNNVIILYSVDCKEYIKYVEEKYGKSYFES